MRRSVVLSTVLLAGATSVALSQQLPLRHDPEVLRAGPARIERVKDGLYVVRGPFVPCTTRGCRANGPDDGLIHEAGDVAVRLTPEGLILIDDKYPEFVEEVLARIREVSPLPVRYMLNSHHHGDHVSGNSIVRQMGIDVIAHRNIRENFLRIRQAGEPNIVFADEAEVHLGGVEVRLRWLGRAHTNGDTVIHFPDLRVVHAGDIIIDGMPVIDYAGGGSAVEFVATIDRLLEIDFDTVIPGHGRVMNRDAVRAYRQRFVEMNARMRAAIRRGVSRDDFANLDRARAELGLADLGWENTVSTTAWHSGVGRYYDEIAALP